MADPTGGAEGGGHLTGNNADRHIVIIDDDPPFLELMANLLADDEGYTVTTFLLDAATHGTVSGLQPDLIILDLVNGSPESGWRALDAFTTDAATGRIPVILSSAATDILASRTEWTDRLDVTALARPFDIEVLLGHVRAKLGATRSGTNITRDLDREATERGS